MNIIAGLDKATNQQVLDRVARAFDASSRVTIVRDLNALVKLKFIKKRGKGRGVYYEPAAPSLLRMFDTEAYFQQETDQRTTQLNKIVFEKPSAWTTLFTRGELHNIEGLTTAYRKRFNAYHPKNIKKELERVTIEFSWKSSHIEGNTYSLLDTERLIKEHHEAKGKTREEARMILNHKRALEYAWNNPAHFRTISIHKLGEIHSLIAHGLNIAKGLRKRPVGIIGTSYRPHDNVHQVRDALEFLCRLLNSIEHPFTKACVAVAGLSYIQPFEDGNKRTSRLLGNAILLAHGYCPLSYRSIDEIEYKKAMIIFYEQHSLAPFKKLFSEQYEFACGNYFL